MKIPLTPLARIKIENDVLNAKIALLDELASVSPEEIEGLEHLALLRFRNKVEKILDEVYND